MTKDAWLFMCLQRGNVACFEHLGRYGQDAVAAAPDAAQWITPLNIWVATSAAEREEYVREVGAPMQCETCGYSPDDRTAVR